MGVNTTASQVFTVQTIVTLLVAVVCLLIDPVAGYSALLGGLVCMIPGVYAMVRMTKARRVKDPGLSAVLSGEVGKLVLSVALFAIVFVTVRPLKVEAFFGTFVILQLLYILIPFREAVRLRRIHTVEQR